MTDTLNDLTKRVADAIDQRFHDMGFEADPRNDPLWHKGVSIEIAKAAIAEVKRGEIPVNELETMHALLYEAIDVGMLENITARAILNDVWKIIFPHLYPLQKREEAMVLTKIAFTCERTGRRWQFDSMTKFIEAFLDATQPVRESGERAKTKDLVNMIRMKLERRFQVADYMPDSYAEPHSCRGLVSDMCQDFMAHVREVHALAERALNSIENGSANG